MRFPLYSQAKWRRFRTSDQPAPLVSFLTPRSTPLRLTQARIGDTLYNGNGTRVAVVTAFTTVNPDTEAIVRAVDYQVVNAMSAAAGEESA